MTDTGLEGTEQLDVLIEVLHEKEIEFTDKYHAEESGYTRQADLFLGRLRAYRDAKREVMKAKSGD